MKLQGNQRQISKWELNFTMANEGQWHFPNVVYFKLLVGRAKLEWNVNTIHKELKFRVSFLGILKNKNKTSKKLPCCSKNNRGLSQEWVHFKRLFARTSDLESRSHQHWHGAFISSSTVCSQGNEDTWKEVKVLEEF